MKLRKIKLKVYSKINLSLNIVGVRDNMHVLDMVMASADIADVITVCERLDDKVGVEYLGCKSFGESDTALRAVRVLQEKFGSFGADIFIEKNIPVGAGMGGSSADAAGVMFALDKLFDFSLRGLNVQNAALAVGSDVPYMLSGGFSRVRGTGGEVQKITSDIELNFVLAKGVTGVSTAAAYRRFDELNPSKKLLCCDSDLLCSALEAGDVSAVIEQCGNALSEASKSINPEIEGTLLSLDKAGAKKSIMTGSGAGCVGFFDDYASAVAASEKLKEQGLYARPCRTKKSGIEMV